MLRLAESLLTLLARHCWPKSALHQHALGWRRLLSGPALCWCLQLSAAAGNALLVQERAPCLRLGHSSISGLGLFACIAIEVGCWHTHPSTVTWPYLSPVLRILLQADKPSLKASFALHLQCLCALMQSALLGLLLHPPVLCKALHRLPFTD